MAKKQSDKLWLVKAKNSAGESAPPYSSLWVLAEDTEVASRKARRWLRSNQYHGYHISTVESHGTIDAF